LLLSAIGRGPGPIAEQPQVYWEGCRLLVYFALLFSMLYAFAAYDFNDSHTNDLEIELKRSPLQILIIELHFDWNRQFVASVDQCPSGLGRDQAASYISSKANVTMPPSPAVVIILS
jgi:hypothetical protein